MLFKNSFLMHHSRSGSLFILMDWYQNVLKCSKKIQGSEFVQLAKTCDDVLEKARNKMHGIFQNIS